MTYRGWDIWHDRFQPVTGQWRAMRFGVGMCAGTKEALHRMIDSRIAEKQNSGPIHNPHGYRIP